MHSVVEQKIISDEYFNFNENSYESIVYPKCQDLFNNQGNMQNSSINPNDGCENSVIYNHFDQDSNLDENSCENMAHSSSEDISNNQDNIRNSSPRLNYEHVQNEIQSVKGFKIAHLNIRSLLKHIDEFRIFLRKKHFDIICLNETLLDETIANNEVLIDGYQIIRKDRIRHGGGVLLYIRDTINCKLRSDLMLNSLEMVTIEVLKPKAKSFLINAWYRPPSSKVEIFDDYESILQKLDAGNVEVICIGDFNCDWFKQGTQSLVD